MSCRGFHLELHNVNQIESYVVKQVLSTMTENLTSIVVIAQTKFGESWVFFIEKICREEAELDFKDMFDKDKQFPWQV